MPCGLEERKGVKEDYKKLEDVLPWFIDLLTPTTFTNDDICISNFL